ncbi:MAG TPA: hypothetical protein VL550_08190 [Rhodocyclaceae bacterium]|nr:hypothetical protein [Rhodocyclaceae bacterium]
MNRTDQTGQMQSLEYAIRQSMSVREDQEDPADPLHIEEARRYGIPAHDDLSKGDLLSLVQTHLRAR